MKFVNDYGEFHVMVTEGQSRDVIVECGRALISTEDGTEIRRLGGRDYRSFSTVAVGQVVRVAPPLCGENTFYGYYLRVK